VASFLVSIGKSISKRIRRQKYSLMGKRGTLTFNFRNYLLKSFREINGFARRFWKMGIKEQFVGWSGRLMVNLLPQPVLMLQLRYGRIKEVWKLFVRVKSLKRALLFKATLSV